MKTTSLLVILLGFLGTACGSVAPHERALLAHPTMTQEMETASGSHVYAVHEGAAGGGSVAESGCGCN